MKRRKMTKITRAGLGLVLFLMSCFAIQGPVTASAAGENQVSVQVKSGHPGRDFRLLEPCLNQKDNNQGNGNQGNGNQGNGNGDQCNIANGGTGYGVDQANGGGQYGTFGGTGLGMDKPPNFVAPPTEGGTMTTFGGTGFGVEDKAKLIKG